MDTRFKKHERVRLLRDPDARYVEYHTENTNGEEIPIKKGMIGVVNLILPNGDYHVKILDADGEELAYIMIDEESLELVDL